MSSVLSDFLQQVFTLIFTTAVVIFLGGKLAWVLLIFVPIVIGSIRKIGRGVRQTTRKGQDKLAEIQNILHETITGNRIVKAFNMEFWELLRFRQAARRLFRANLSSVRAQAISSPLMDFIGAVAIALLLLFGRNAINSRVMTTGTFFAFIVALFKLYDPVRRSAVYYNSFQQALGASQAIFEFMEDQDEVVERKHAFNLKGFRECHPVLKTSASPTAPKKAKRKSCTTSTSTSVTAKSSLSSAPAGQGSPPSSISSRASSTSPPAASLIDGHDLRDVSLRSLREQIGKVTQETILFNDTVRNNIAYGQPDVPLSRVVEAAQGRSRPRLHPAHA